MALKPPPSWSSSSCRVSRGRRGSRAYEVVGLLRVQFRVSRVIGIIRISRVMKIMLRIIRIIL